MLFDNISADDWDGGKVVTINMTLLVSQNQQLLVIGQILMQKHEPSLAVCIGKAFGFLYHFIKSQCFNQRGYVLIIENVVKLNDGIALAGNDAPEGPKCNLI
jgi:hypothetical protein